MKVSEVLLAFITRVYGVKAARAAKAILPATTAVLATLGQWIATGKFDAAETATVVIGLGGALLTYVVPNLTQLAESRLKQGAPVMQAVSAATGDGEQTEFREEGPGQPPEDGADWTVEDEPSDIPDPPTDEEIREASLA